MEKTRKPPVKSPLDGSGANVRGSADVKGLNAVSLAGIGIGGIIGAGFFLGSGLAVHEAGPSVTLAFVLGGLIMMQVLGAMTTINVNRLAHGSFRVYAEQLLGPFFGYLIGWVVFASGVLGLGSEALAMGVFAHLWLPHVPTPLLSLLFTLAVVGLNALGVQNFGRIETVLGAVKVLALLGFIALGTYAIVRQGALVSPTPFSGTGAFFPTGVSGLLQSMLVVLFCFSGIGAVAMASSEAQHPKRDIPRAAVYLTVGIIALYAVSMLVLVSLTHWSSVYTDKSPFVQALTAGGHGVAASVMNAVILVAAFSVMAATFYSTMQMLVSLAEGQKAPHAFQNRTGGGLYRNAWLVVGGAALVVVGSSYVMPSSLFNYLVSASSYFTFLNWSLNLTTYLAWRKKKRADETFHSNLIWGKAGAFVTMFAIVVLAAMSLWVPDFRMGAYFAAGIIAVVCLSYLGWSSKGRTARKY
ncbi:amino acid permease [Tumebacillus flagellatus]|uniref:Gamma-aminobutyrate permease-like transporter n=1 Tax=Tumebacillus flagellatus TaxID=1157490 RepID=A0A074LUC8_9BACL|nr:amino acid permease [Tumebacillus flagellatus]KEO84175.1 gamma-aminobutyrate permease-like transporter [Tumebacillus flagellatus]